MAERVIPGDGLVQVAYLHPHTVSHSWHESMMRLVGYDAANDGRIVSTGGPFMIRCDSGGLVESRNLAVRRWLDETPHEWLWFIDTDMGFLPDTIDRLVAAADPATRPVVGGLCFGLRETSYDGYGGRHVRPVPTLFRPARTPEGHVGFTTRWDYPANSLVQVAGTGAACLLIHRSAAEKIRAEHGDTWFDQVRYQDGRPVSEDLSFCYRLAQAGIPVFVHTGVKTTHHKQVWVSEDDYHRDTAPPPATEPTAVIVPVLGRPQNAEPFMASLRASTGIATVYAVAGPEDTAEAHQATVAAWQAAGAQVITAAGTTFAEKVNLGYRETAEPYVFIVGDDVRFHPGWLDHAQAAARDTGATVVGTNDLANPRVMAGEHGTHLLISRQYVDEHGASWDGPGAVAHEGYRHWYVDDEIVTAARQRGMWASAAGSVVEHLHPIAGKGQMDAVYELGQASADRDRELFEKRVAEHAS